MAIPECQSTVTKYQYREMQELERSLDVMKHAGIAEIDPPWQSILSVQRWVIRQIGIKLARPITLIKAIFGLSPGEIRLWHDAESGFFAEARAKPGAPPVYHHVSDEVAIAILKEEVTPELEKELLTPDPYLGE